MPRYPSTAGQSFRRAIALAVLLAALPPATAAINADNLYREGVSLYEQGQYRRAAQTFKQAIETEPNSRNYHWLGKSYGQLAERASLIEALRLARQTQHALEQAVALDAGNREAVEDLMEYYDRAPAILGGDPDKAKALKQHVVDLDNDGKAGSSDDDNPFDEYSQFNDS